MTLEDLADTDAVYELVLADVVTLIWPALDHAWANWTVRVYAALSVMP